MIDLLPIYATALGALLLMSGLILASYGMRMVGLLLVLLGCLSAWPVFHAGTPRSVETAALGSDLDSLFAAHASRGRDHPWGFYLSGAAATIALLAQVRRWKAEVPLAAIALFAAIACLALGFAGDSMSDSTATPLSSTTETSRRTASMPPPDWFHASNNNQATMPS